MSETNDPDETNRAGESSDQPGTPDDGQTPGHEQAPDYGQPPGDGQPPGGYGQPPGGYGQPPGGYGQPAGFGPGGYGQGPAGGPATPYWQPVPGPPAPPGYADADVTISELRSPILVSFAPPAKQRRVTVLFRLLLAIPQLVAALALVIAAEIVTIVGWFAALFIGRLPEWAHTFLTQVLRWNTRVAAYVNFLTDVYPPFSLDDVESYPVRLVSRQTKLNRLAVFFRIILAIPANIVFAVLGYGLFALGIIVWLIALIIGELPPALHQAISAITRYSARYYGWYAMVTAVYPVEELYGDRLLPATVGDPLAPMRYLGPDIAASDASAPPAMADGPQPQESAALPMTDEAAWRLSLSSGARKLLTTFVVVGAIAYGAAAFINSETGPNTISNTIALVQVESANSALTKSSQGFQAAVQACGDQLSCATGQLADQANRLETFDGAINAVGLTGQAGTDAATLISEDHAVEQDLNQLAAATSGSQYLSILRSSTLQQDLSKANADFSKLVTDLGGRTS